MKRPIKNKHHGILLRYYSGSFHIAQFHTAIYAAPGPRTDNVVKKNGLDARVTAEVRLEQRSRRAIGQRVVRVAERLALTNERERGRSDGNRKTKAPLLYREKLKKSMTHSITYAQAQTRRAR